MSAGAKGREEIVDHVTKKVQEPVTVTGYRMLSGAEIDLINEVKAMGASIDGMLATVGNHLREQYAAAPTEERQRIDRAQAERWRALARTDFQTALMALVRSIAQPTSF